MQSRILYIFTRTPLHVGAGSSVGAIDQPIQRERHTGFPIIPGSSIKGVLADPYNAREDGRILKDLDRNATKRTADGAKLFGLGASKQEGDSGQAGTISFGQATLLAFPVRSAKGCFAWLTSPLLLERWKRATGINLGNPKVTIEANKACFSEDYVFHHECEFTAAQCLADSIKVDGLWSSHALDHLVLVSDEIVAHFAVTACEVAQHVVIDDETGTAKDGLLFNQENVPAETLFYATLHAKDQADLDAFTVPNPIQLGGDASTGLGFCSTQLV